MLLGRIADALRDCLTAVKRIPRLACGVRIWAMRCRVQAQDRRARGMGSSSGREGRGASCRRYSTSISLGSVISDPASPAAAARSAPAHGNDQINTLACFPSCQILVLSSLRSFPVTFGFGHWYQVRAIIGAGLHVSAHRRAGKGGDVKGRALATWALGDGDGPVAEQPHAAWVPQRAQQLHQMRRHWRRLRF